MLNMKFLKKFLSRKFVLVIIATVLVWTFVFLFKDVNPDICKQALNLWAMILGGYIGVNGIQNVVFLNKNKSGSNEE